MENKVLDNINAEDRQKKCYKIIAREVKIFGEI